MKRLQPSRWSGSVLPPRPRTVRCQYVCKFAPTARLQSTATAALRTDNDDLSNPLPTRVKNDYDTLTKLPSPSPSQARQSAKLAALHSRLKLPQRLPLETLARCLVHDSADPNSAFNNTSLALLGHQLLGYYTSEHILCKYPRLPMTVLFAAMRAYVGPPTLTIMTREWGVDSAAAPGGEVDPGLLQFKKQVAGNADLDRTGHQVKEDLEELDRRAKRMPWRSGVSSFSIKDSYFGDAPDLPAYSDLDFAERPELREQEMAQRREKGTTLESASTSFIQAVVGAVYLHAGKKSTKEFFEAHFASRHLDVSKMFEFKRPTLDLSRLCAREGFEAPVARIISETGRLSRHPVFVVGVFSGRDKLGEGQGGSLDEARIRAAVQALKGWYLYSPVEARVPSEMDGKEQGQGRKWDPVLIDGGEIVS